MSVCPHDLSTICAYFLMEYLLYSHVLITSHTHSPKKSDSACCLSTSSGLIPGFSGLSVVYIDSGVQYTISKSYITSMSPAFVPSMILHTSRSKYENRLVLIIMVHNGAVILDWLVETSACLGSMKGRVYTSEGRRVGFKAS